MALICICYSFININFSHWGLTYKTKCFGGTILHLFKMYVTHPSDLSPRIQYCSTSGHCHLNNPCFSLSVLSSTVKVQGLVFWTTLVSCFIFLSSSWLKASIIVFLLLPYFTQHDTFKFHPDWRQKQNFILYSDSWAESIIAPDHMLFLHSPVISHLSFLVVVNSVVINVVVHLTFQYLYAWGFKWVFCIIQILHSKIVKL